MMEAYDAGDFETSFAIARQLIRHGASSEEVHGVATASRIFLEDSYLTALGGPAIVFRRVPCQAECADGGSSFLLSLIDQGFALGDIVDCCCDGLRVLKELRSLVQQGVIAVER